MKPRRKRVYLPPFDKCDREADMRQAYRAFQERPKEEKNKPKGCNEAAALGPKRPSRNARWGTISGQRAITGLARRAAWVVRT
jgi:hypothetical protein